jgi:putative ABC transport system permease protein
MQVVGGLMWCLTNIKNQVKLFASVYKAKRHPDMFKNYFKTAWRNLWKNKGYAFINISGLAVGMAVAILIGLWIYDELSFNKNFKNYDRIAQVMQHQTFNGDTGTQSSLPYLMGEELKKNYGGDFKYIAMATWTHDRILSFGQKAITKSGNFFEPQIAEMLSLKMIAGTRKALNDNNSVILSASTAKALFGDADPMNKIIKIDNRYEVKVSGIYEDLPYNSDFNNLTFIAPWQMFIDKETWLEKATNPWRNNSFQAYVQLADNADLNNVSPKIKDAKLRNVSPADAAFKPEVFLQPMSKWHLYSEFKNGINTGGRIEFVWLFGIIGFFVLLLACINFMNLSTARSEKRAKEVGIRKAIGSLRSQLIRQFFCESLLVTVFAFGFSLIFVQLILPSFNEVADKKMSILWSNPFFWLAGIAFTIFTGFIAGSYPALYLSSFKPVKVLKGTFRVGRFAAVPRKVLVVMQFTVSVILIIGTIVIFNQIQFAKDRPVGYSRDGLVNIYMVTENIHNHFDAVSIELKSSSAVSQIAESSSATYYVDETDNGFSWEGKDPSLQGDFGVVYASRDYGKTIGWQFKEGRDFSRDFLTDSSGIILNEAAVKFMNLQDPVGKTITWDGNQFHVLGVVKDMVMQSPYDPVFRTVFVTNKDPQQVIDLRINPSSNMHDALVKIESVFKKYNPEQPFDYHFADTEYAKKFGDEERTGKLASFFAVLAIFISCLGLFGMASFMAEQRVKEIGVRKVLGASVFNVWRLLSKDFLVLILFSLVIAGPLAYYFMHSWLQNYQYHTALSWWIFAVTAAGALLITLITVSFQAIKAAVANPIKSLRTE